ncbi:AEC family transporter [Salinibacterium soli]|uniref:AEC family transporter n=1 Tax=Antiquaquibacter soli TaxID=3064523 RepID=A0ABT9BPU8_9MICO|nr:AEC family transporter [Protaetiibacter sp. WY-16]MDO7883053.1 AEC family transporter [Protaetiibacter sp. WY-16]
MIGVLIGFAVIATIILIGYIVGRSGVLGEHAQFVLGRFAFYVASPCLLFTVLADADIHVLFSSQLLVSFVAAVGSGLVFFTIARLLWRRELSESIIGSLGSGYVNANNMGIPVAVFVLGDAAFAAPVVLLQLLVFAPVALTALDVQQHGGGSIGRILLRPFRNPIIVGSALGVLVSALQWTPPDEVMQPFRIIGAAAVPVMLVSFGMSLHGQRPLAPGSSRRDVLLASSLKLALMPTIAWAFGYFGVGLTGLPLFAAVVLAALPAAQNVFNYAQRYGRGVIMARDIVLITTVLSLPALVVVAALLAP